VGLDSCESGVSLDGVSKLSLKSSQKSRMSFGLGMKVVFLPSSNASRSWVFKPNTQDPMSVQHDSS